MKRAIFDGMFLSLIVGSFLYGCGPVVSTENPDAGQSIDAGNIDAGSSAWINDYPDCKAGLATDGGDINLIPTGFVCCAVNAVYASDGGFGPCATGEASAASCSTCEGNINNDPYPACLTYGTPDTAPYLCCAKLDNYGSDGGYGPCQDAEDNYIVDGGWGEMTNCGVCHHRI